MPELLHKIGFIGAGNMGQAMIGALIKSKCSVPSDLFVCDVVKKQTDILKKTYGITVLTDNGAVIDACDVIIFAVKPQSVEQVLSELKDAAVFKKISGKKIFISIAAGTPIKKFENYIYDAIENDRKRQMPILRVMPNTPALVLSGMSGLCANSYATSEHIEIAKTILTSMGKVIECRESDMDAVTAVSGSGPAYCFYLVEAMIEAGVKLGISPEDAAVMTAATLKGSLILLEKQKISAEELRKKVTSPGGTTEAAIKVLEDNSVKQIITQAVIAAAQRSKELSG
ncbi:MAG: pyrroline-5-carboxylate reductase [Desulfobacteraceae bacterium]|nr:pyrroline-5-carboxylate reductase [Desulfobacteraceae bacterium]MBC2757027.1 pyrroline-5-carboxylate reductase [Desulfobacteraceae bacterium]